MYIDLFEQKVRDIVEPTLADLNLRVVRAKMMDQSGRKTLQIMLERLNGESVIVDDCANASYAMSVLFELDDPVDGAYHLEVSSAGIDRPLVRYEDFEKYIGFLAKVEMSMMIDGRRRFRGEIKSVADNKVAVEVDGMVYELPYADMQQAKLVLTDELVEKVNSE